MKARIPQEPRCVLLWRFTPQSSGYGALERAARSYKLKIRLVGEAELAMTLRELCSGRAVRPDALPLASPTDLPAMIVSGLRHDDGSLEGFLDRVKSGGAAFPIRAAVTPTSKEWTLDTLLQELVRERQADPNLT